jgi:hypothetical protein
LWSNVAEGDPASLIAIAAEWAGHVGWQRHSMKLLAELFVQIGPRRPDLLDSMIQVLGEIQAEDGDLADEAFRPPSAFIDELEGIRRTQQLQALAQQIVSQLDPASFEGQDLPHPERLTGDPDPFVDRLLDDFCADDPERQYAATVQLGPAMQKPSPAFVDGLCEVVDELLDTSPEDERIDKAIYALYFACERHAGLVPTEYLQRWLESGAPFTDSQVLRLLSILASARPDWIVENDLERALSVSVAESLSGHMLWSRLGVAYPGLLLQIARAWFEQVGWASQFGRELVNAFKDVARALPDSVETWIALLQEQAEKEGEPEPGIVRLGPSLTGDIAELERLGREQA